METTANKKGTATNEPAMQYVWLIESVKTGKAGIEDAANVLQHIYSEFVLFDPQPTKEQKLHYEVNRQTIGSMINLAFLRLMDISEDLGNQLDRIDD